VPGDHPDPSLLRERGGWYAASTSGDWLPGFPLLHSRDLRRWRQVGSVLSRRPAWVAGDLWAPELQRRGGRVLAYYAARARSGRRCIAVASATHVRGPYRDHGPLACSRVGEIDPLPVEDEYGSDWLVWKRDGNSRGLPTPILAAPLAPGGIALAGPPRELFRADAPWEHGLVEAPALLRRHGLFYIVYSAGRCCGLRCNYRTGVARSRSLLGPWEKRPEPLIRADVLFRCPGHGSVTTGPGGTPLLAYHAYARGDTANRQFLISRLAVPAEGWPVLRGSVASPSRARAQRFSFGARLGQGWQWPVGARPGVRVVGGRLRLRGGALAKQARSAGFSAQVRIGRARRRTRPGLAVMGSARDGVGVEIHGRRAIAWRLEGRRRQLLGASRVPARVRALRVSVGRGIRLAVRWRRGWRRVGPAAAPPPWRSGPRVTLTARGRGVVTFDDLWIRPR
jgi:GH43 family beta-xylosidase